MAQSDDGWKKRQGLDFPIDIDIDDDDDDNVNVDSNLRYDNSCYDDYDGRCDSMPLEEEDYLARYDLKYGCTPPRTTRLRKEREKEAYGSQAKEAAKTIRASYKKKDEKYKSLPTITKQLSLGSDIENSPQKIKLNKKNLQKERSFQRSFKQEESRTIDEKGSNRTLKSTMSLPYSEFKYESMPPLSPALKVGASGFYKCVTQKQLVETAETDCRKISTTEVAQSRLSFFSYLQSTLKSGMQENTNYNKQKSKEEVLYQQELSEVIWLELQAWHAGQDCHKYDSQLLGERKQVSEVYNEVLEFNLGVLSSIDNDLDHIPTNVTFTTTDTTDGASMSRTKEVGGEVCSGCLSIWCQFCRDRETEALQRVHNLLVRIEQVESLFPSTEKLCTSNPTWRDTEFVKRYKALQLWFNIMMQLREKIQLLYNRLGHMSNSLIPWPTFPNLFQSIPIPTVSRDSGHHEYESEDDTDSKAFDIPVDIRKSSIPSVKFDEAEDLIITPSDSVNSIESDRTSASSNYLSPPNSQNIPNSGSLKRCSSDIFIEANPYRKYIEKLLRNKGMKTTFDKVAGVIRDVMSRTICVVEQSYPELFLESYKDIKNEVMAENIEELKRYGSWTSTFKSMNLPGFHGAFLFLAYVPLHMMKECLKLRLEQMPSRPSRLSIKQLMREYKESVKFAVVVRQKYVRWCNALFVDLEPNLKENLELRQNQAIEELDGDVKKMLEVYLDWLDQFVLMLHREPHVSGLQRNFLQEEWRFVQSTCPHVTEGDSLAATRFCNIASHMLCSVADFLDAGLDDLNASLQELSILHDGDSNQNSNESEHLEELHELVQNGPQEDMVDHQKRQTVQRCRALQDLLLEARERALRAAGLAKMLRKDLEVAIECSSKNNTAALLQMLKETNHIQILAPHSSNHLIFVPDILEGKLDIIRELLNMRVGIQSVDETPGYIVLVNCTDNMENQWSGRQIKIEPTADCTITLSRIQSSGLLVMVQSGNQLTPVRRQFMHQMGKVVSIEREQTAPHKAVSRSLEDMKVEAVRLCEGLTNIVTLMQNLLDASQITDIDEYERKQILHITRDTIHQGFIFGFDFHREVTRLVTGPLKEKLVPFLVTFAKMWMKFVQSSYSSGRGKRPRWAIPGLEFLLFICDPSNTRHLSDKNFMSLKDEIEECRVYIVGTSGPLSPSTTPHTPVLTRHFRSASSSSAVTERSMSVISTASDSTINPLDSPLLNRRAAMRRPQLSIDTLASQEDDGPPEPPIIKIRRKIEKMERKLEEYRKDEAIVGRVINTQRSKVTLKSHTVSFSWHRSFKIGAGRFGKVYSAINNNNGELMAMKVLPLHPNDHSTVRKVADELRIFEGINHPNLVKYYGVEIHNDEMLMFMEFCDEGTLEALALSTETGLPEEIVRKYTRQLLDAVFTLHDNGVVHRDIKGANIFLTQESNVLKLGDFGCAVRLGGAQTEVGELSGIVGTHAYMAPEIFQSSEGHGRAADIWSLGCVVIEMATGKRPWPEYDSSVQIMFKVGMGQSPSLPPCLSEEGHYFLTLCFKHDPKLRATATDLLDHTFVKVDSGEECSSLPLFSHQPNQAIYNFSPLHAAST